MERIFKAQKEKGKFLWLEEDLMKKYIDGLNDGFYDLIIRKKKKSRSNNQNRYLWGVVYKMIADETGHSSDEVHEHVRWRFLRKHGKLETVRSTPDLSTVEMEKYLEDIRRFCATELNLSIPLPNEVDYAL